MMEKESEEFKIRSYLKADLAQLYLPYLSSGAALKKMQKWIRNNPAFHAELYSGTEGKNEQAFSKRQVEVVVKYLDPP